LGAAAAATSPASQFCGSSCNNAKFMTFLNSAISSRYLPANPIVGGAGTGSGGCPSSSSATGAATAAKFSKIGAAMGGVAVGVLHAAAVTGPAAPVVAAVAAVLAIIGGIFAHHAQAEAMQSNVLCENVPAANAALQGIDQMLANGTLSASDAATAYQQLAAQFNSAMRSDPSYKKGDALDGYNLALQAVIAARIADLQTGLLTGGAPAPFAGTAGAVTGALGLPPAALLLGAIAAAWFLL
jgi:hypothetical protein